MKIAVMGAGGIGGYLGGRLAEAGQEVHLIARGAHLAALKAGGLRIESPHGDVHVPGIGGTDDPGEIGPVDVVLFTVKLGDGDAAARSLAPMIGPRTRVVTLQNGIDSKDMIAAHVERARISAGIIYLAAHIREPGVITNPGGIRKVVVDRLGDDPVMAEFLAVCEGLKGADVSGTDASEHVVWEKFVALSAFAAVTCLARQPIGAIYAHLPLLDFYRRLLEENVAVALAQGQDFADGHAQNVIDTFASQPYEQKSSMLVDLEAGKPLELPWLAGRVAALGAEHGVPTPANSAVLAALAPYVNGAPADRA